MNTLAWIAMLGIIFLTPLTLLNKENRSKEEIRRVIITIVIALGIIVAVLFFNVVYLRALIVGGIAMILFDKKTYTKKRLLIYSSILVFIGIAAFSVSRDNPDYVLNHLKKNPQTTSLYIAENGVDIITYQSDVVRPLASTVKMLIAVEYAMQIDAGILSKDSTVSLDDIARFYYNNSDGNGHVTWLKRMESEGKMKDNVVTLHDVAQGMITYSSNANTDYLIHLLGMEKINERAKSLGLTQHEEVYPIVSAQLIPKLIENASMSEKQLIEKLEEMPMETYRSTAIAISEKMREGSIKVEEIPFDIPIKVQRVWSDRLIGASANEYGKLLAIISNDELPKGASDIARNLFEWPMQYNTGNHEYYAHLGAKGGSTAFVLNDAMYSEDHAGNKIEFVILTDDLNFLQAQMLLYNMNSFESKILGDKEYLQKVRSELSEI